MPQYKKHLTTLLLLTCFVFTFSQQKIDSLKQLLPKTNNDTSIVGLYGFIGDEFYYSGLNDSAIFYWEQAKEVALRSKQKELPDIYNFIINQKLAVLYNDIAYLKINNGDYNEAVHYFNECIYLKQQTNDIEGEIQSYTNLGYLYISKNQIDSALLYNLTSYKLAKKQNLEDLAAVSAMQIGVLHTKTGAINQALKRLNESAQYFDQTKNTKALAVAYNNIAKAYEVLEKNTIALEYFFKSLKIKLNNENNKGAAIVYNNIGACYQKIQELELAIKYNKKALNLFKLVNNKVGEATTLNNIGIMHFLNFELDSALINYNQSLTIRRTINDIEGIAISQINISKIHFERENYTEAINCLNEAIVIVKQIKNTPLIADCSMQLYKNHEKKKDFQTALIHYKDFTKYDAILFSEKNLKRANLIQHQIEIKQRNYKDSISQVLQIQSDKEVWEAELRTENYIIKKEFSFIVSLIILILFSLLVYYYIQNKTN